MNCKDCGEQMEGDGYTTVFHCPNVDVSDITPDCNPVYCELGDELSEFEEEYNNMIPDWATGKNKLKELIVGTQLCTKDGRRTGNARIISIEERYGHIVYVARTDAGNLINLVESEVHSMFYIGEWLLPV